MARWLITFGILIVLGSLLWPWLRQLGLARLPGDMAVDFIPGISFYLPITTAAYELSKASSEIKRDMELGSPRRC